jgi:hypothetical protein
MLCIGRSNYLRFNHPAEARLMKTILPNTRISVVPLTPYPGDVSGNYVYHLFNVQQLCILLTECIY